MLKPKFPSIKLPSKPCLQCSIILMFSHKAMPQMSKLGITITHSASGTDPCNTLQGSLSSTLHQNKSKTHKLKHSTFIAAYLHPLASRVPKKINSASYPEHDIYWIMFLLTIKHINDNHSNSNHLAISIVIHGDESSTILLRGVWFI